MRGSCEPDAAAWMLLGDVVSRLSNGPYGASCGLLRGLIGDTK